jgi:hypothetical protein
VTCLQPVIPPVQCHLLHHPAHLITPACWSSRQCRVMRNRPPSRRLCSAVRPSTTHRHSIWRHGEHLGLFCRHRPRIFVHVRYTTPYMAFPSSRMGACKRPTYTCSVGTEYMHAFVQGTQPTRGKGASPGYKKRFIRRSRHSEACPIPRRPAVRADGNGCLRLGDLMHINQPTHVALACTCTCTVHSYGERTRAPSRAMRAKRTPAGSPSAQPQPPPNPHSQGERTLPVVQHTVRI